MKTLGFNQCVREELINKLLGETIKYFDGDVKRINHLIKVFTFAKLIGETELKDEFQKTALYLSAIVHDAGIKISEEKYNSASGKYQEIEGPAIAEELLAKIGCEDKELIERIKYLVAHHHTYSDIDGLDMRILLEADFIVNAYEDGLSKNSIIAAVNNFFETEKGVELVYNLYLER